MTCSGCGEIFISVHYNLMFRIIQTKYRHTARDFRRASDARLSARGIRRASSFLRAASGGQLPARGLRRTASEARLSARGFRRAASGARLPAHGCRTASCARLSARRRTAHGARRTAHGARRAAFGPPAWLPDSAWLPASGGFRPEASGAQLPLAAHGSGWPSGAGGPGQGREGGVGGRGGLVL